MQANKRQFFSNPSHLGEFVLDNFHGYFHSLKGLVKEWFHVLLPTCVPYESETNVRSLFPFQFTNTADSKARGTLLVAEDIESCAL